MPLTAALRASVLVLIAIPVFGHERQAARIPDWTVWVTLCSAVVMSLATEAPVPIAAPSVSIALSAILGLAIPLLARSLVPRGLGWGDVKLSFALFLLLGPVAGVVGLFAACVIALSGMALAALCEGFQLRGDAGIPFGPSMIAGALVALTLEISI